MTPAWRRAVATLVPPLAAGGAVAAALPPVGLWPLGIAGLGLLSWLLRDRPPARRALVGWLFGVGLFIPGWWWMSSFTGPGFPVAAVLEAAFYAGAALVTPPRTGHTLGFAAAVAGAGVARDAWPFGGVPLAGVALGQAGGPLGQVARLGGVAAVTFVAALAGAGLSAAVVAAREVWRRGPGAWRIGDRPWRPAAAAATALALAAAAVAYAYAAPDGGPARHRITVAAVQGGGPRGLRAIYRDPSLVFAAQVDAAGGVRAPVALTVWPENVVELNGPLDGSPEDAELSSLAETDGTTLVAGVTEPAGTAGFRNEVFAWTADGHRVGPYRKVHRVPFGEWIPFRGVLRHVANLDAVPRDELAGRGPGLLRTPAGPLGVMISYEVFFDERALAATRSGARLLVVPTNAASYSTGQVPAMEVAASRLRAIESGRDLAQAAPTGFSALVDHRGRVLARSSLGGRQVVQGALGGRSGTTPFVAGGLAWPRSLVGVALLTAWATALAAGRRRRMRRR